MSFDHNTKYLIALSHFPKLGAVRLKKLCQYFATNLEAGFKASQKELVAAGIDEKIASEFIAARNGIKVEEIISQLEAEEIKVVRWDEENYPPLLKEIYDPPALLYYRGQLTKDDEYCLAVVGARNFSPYGQQVTEKIVRELAQNHITIVSGLAYGIDSLAHNATLDVGGRTIAVLGTGLDKASIYPNANRYLADKIVSAGGAVISEFPLKTPPLRYNFPLRNRIIAGLSLGVLVVEAAEKSGALITAQCALDQNREVFAVPGSIYSEVSRGPNFLIKQGARAVTEAADIITALDLTEINTYIENKKIIGETEEEKKILALLDHEPKYIDELIRSSGLDASLVNSALALMEMKGIIKNLGGQQYVLAR